MALASTWLVSTWNLSGCAACSAIRGSAGQSGQRAALSMSGPHWQMYGMRSTWHVSATLADAWHVQHMACQRHTGSL